VHCALFVPFCSLEGTWEILSSIFVISIRVCPKIVCREIIEDRIIGLFRCVVLNQENVCGKGNMLRSFKSSGSMSGRFLGIIG
jgi:hypothetical protein